MPTSLENAKAWRDRNKDLLKIRRKRYNAAYKAKNPDKAKRSALKYRSKPEVILHERGRYLKNKYGITFDDYENLFAAQGGVCAVCKRPETIVIGNHINNLAVDHDHRTGKIRGLLCFACNTAIGQLDENPDRMRTLAIYIEEHRKLEVCHS